MIRKNDTTPQINIIVCEDLCETIIVNFSQEGPGVVDSRKKAWDDDEEEVTSNYWAY